MTRPTVQPLLVGASAPGSARLGARPMAVSLAAARGPGPTGDVDLGGWAGPVGWTAAARSVTMSPMTDPTVLDDLEARGLVQECTDRDALRARLAQGPITLYYGCDPTADSLHVGNLIGLLVLRRFQEAGHRPIALAGGATGMVGDPGGRSEERNLLDEATLRHNVASIKEQMGRIVELGKGGSDGALVDNREWTADLHLMPFL